MSQTLGTVMVIDDEDIDQRQYRRLLQRSGLVDDIVQFTYADEALQWLMESPERKIDLILLDINIPRMNGFAFLAEATTKIPAFDAIVVIMLTTSLSPKDKEWADSLDCVRGYFNKPLTMEHLEEALQLMHIAAT